MHRITQKRFGRIADVAENKGFLRWSAFLRDELEQWETVAVPAEIFTAEEHGQLRRILENHASLLDEIRTPCLVHTDLWEGNILVGTAAGKPVFSAIIDADRALWGGPDFEFLDQWMHNDDFLGGYGRPISQDAACITRRKIYRLLCSLWNAYVYQKEYNAREEMERERTACLELITELL